MAYEVEKDWVTKAGLRAVVIIGLIKRRDGTFRKWHRNGYVAVGPEHACYGKGYSEPLSCISQERADHSTMGTKSPLLLLTANVNADDADSVRRSLDIICDVHGGLTYSGGAGYPVAGDDLWWFGFDCGHYQDAEIEPDEDWPPREGVVRELPYVEENCERLAEQLKELA